MGSMSRRSRAAFFGPGLDKGEGLDMTFRTWLKECCSRWPAFPRIARGLLVALSALALIGSGSVVMSFEASGDDTGKPTAQSGAQKPSPGSKKAGASEKKGKGKAAGKNAAKRNEAGAGDPGPTGPLPERPARVVTPPTLTSAELDRMIAQHLTKTDPKVEPATLTSDVEFGAPNLFRRERAPAHADPGRVVPARSRQRQAQPLAVDALLGSPEYARNWANYWREVIMFHATNENPARVGIEEFEVWLAKRLQANTPWDNIVAALITRRVATTRTGRSHSRSPTKPSPSSWRAKPHGFLWESRSSAPSVMITRPTPGNGGSFMSSPPFSPACNPSRLSPGRKTSFR